MSCGDSVEKCVMDLIDALNNLSPHIDQSENRVVVLDSGDQDRLAEIQHRLRALVQTNEK